MFRECLVGRLYSRATHETQLSPSVLTFRIPIMCKAHASFCRILNCEIPAKILQSSIAWVFTFSLSLSLSLSQSLQLNPIINAGYNKLNKITIKFSTELKANKTHSCKLQLYNLLLWLFRDKTFKIDSRLRHEFRNNEKTYSHLI